MPCPFVHFGATRGAKTANAEEVRGHVKLVYNGGAAAAAAAAVAAASAVCTGVYVGKAGMSGALVSAGTFAVGSGSGSVSAPTPTCSVCSKGTGEFGGVSPKTRSTTAKSSGLVIVVNGASSMIGAIDGEVTPCSTSWPCTLPCPVTEAAAYSHPGRCTIRASVICSPGRNAWAL